MNAVNKLAASAAYLASPMQEEEEIDEEEEEVEAPPPPKKVKKSKKVLKTKDKKSAKSSKSKGDGNTVRLKDLAKQAKLTEAVARKKLRDADVPRGEGRWSWDLGSKALKQARKALGLGA